MTKSNKTVEIKISDILKYLQEGYTRTKVEKNYDPEIGSIQEKYDLNKSQIFELFRHEKLKGRKTIVQKVPAFVLIDDLVEDDTSNSNVAEIAVKVADSLEEETSQEDSNKVNLQLIKEVSPPDTQTLTDINDTAAEEAEPEKVEAEAVETDDQDNSWL